MEPDPPPNKEMTRESPVTSPSLARRTSEINGHDADIQQQILQLKKQHQLQQQILLQHFHQQQQQLAEQHEQQLRLHLKKVQEEQERELREKERIESIKKKGKHEQSAVASSEVKQKLQGFLLKKQRDAAAAAGNGGPGTQSNNQTPYRNWPAVAVSGGSVDSQQPQGVSSQFRLNPHIPFDDSEYPLRKTASEPNLLKVRLKQRAIERPSPIARRRDRLIKKKSILAIEPGSSNPDSGPNSPPVQGAVQGLSPPPSSTSNTAPIQEEVEGCYGEEAVAAGLRSDQGGSLSDLSSLYSSPSMPNISLGRPQNSSEKKLALASEAEVRAAFTARFGAPLTGQLLPVNLPFYPTLPVIDADYSDPTSPGFIQKQMQSLEQPHLAQIYHHNASQPPITDSQLSRSGKRPLGRTQSAPLPLGHPMLGHTHTSIVHYEEGPPTTAAALRQQQINAHALLKQQIRQTVLTRVSSRAQSMSSSALENTPEAEDNNDDNNEVIDLTEKSRGSRERLEETEAERQSLLQHQRDLMMRHSLQGSQVVARSAPMARPLTRALSSPLVALGGQTSEQNQSSGPHTSPKLMGPEVGRTGRGGATGLAYDAAMLKHSCSCTGGGWHPEHAGRLQSAWARLMETGLAQRCARLRPRKVSLDELQLCHSEGHVLLFGTNAPNRQKLDVSALAGLPLKSFVRLTCGGVGIDSDTVWNEVYTASAARTAAGCVVDLALNTGMGELRNGFAVVRPPGHHAEASQAMGFCFFNNVAVAARVCLQKLDLQRILIIDWDVHHGNGTQQMFYDDGRVLFLSLHRHDDGNFFPGTGGPNECGIGSGRGYNVNISWSGSLNPPMGDAEYLAAFRGIVMPIAKEFCPELVLVSAGFDAASSHPPPLGGYKLSPACFGYMTKQLMHLADGKVVLALEGGYELAATCDAVEECVKALLGDEPSPLSEEELRRPPSPVAVETLQKTIAIQLAHWPCLKDTAHLVSCSALTASLNEREETETVTAMQALSMQHPQLKSSSECSREPSVEPMEQDEVK